MRTMNGSVVLIVALAAVALCGTSVAQACEDPVWKVARGQWFPEMYYFYHLYQEGVSGSKAVTKRLTAFESKELAEVNAAVVPLNLSKKIIDSIDRITMDELNVRAFPYFALTDKSGKRIAAAGTAEGLVKALAKLRKQAERRKKSLLPPAKVLGVWKSKLPATKATALAEKLKVAAAFKDLPLELIDVDAPSPEQAKRIKALGVVNLPVLLMVGPNRVVLAKLPVDTTEKQLRPLFFSPRRTELARKVLASMITFTIVKGSDAKNVLEARKLVTKATAESRKHFNNVKISVVELDAKDPLEAVLMKNLGIDPKTKKSTIVPVFGLGKAMGKLEPPAKAEVLVEAVAAVNGPCACTVRPSDFGFDLLLRLPEQKEEEKKDK